MERTQLLYGILGKRKAEFIKLNSYQSQADYLKKILDQYSPHTAKTIKLEIRWREKIIIGKYYEYDKIMMYAESLKTVNERIDYLRLVRKNIKNQTLFFDVFILVPGAAYARD